MDIRDHGMYLHCGRLYQIHMYMLVVERRKTRQWLFAWYTIEWHGYTN